MWNNSAATYTLNLKKMSCKKCKTSKCTCETNICINPLIYLFKNVFSLVGTDSDNLIPLEELQKMSKQTITVPSGDNDRYILDLPTALIEGLLGGISISNNKNLCCPDCANGVYFLGSADQFLNLYNGLLNSQTKICCIEHASTLSTWTTVLDELSTELPCCKTDFADAFELWVNASSSSSANFYLDDILELGVFESSSFNGYSGLGILFNYLQLNHPELTSEDYLNILGVIVNLGLVVQCDGCEIVIGSTEQYLKWWDSNYGPVPA